jgi:hypothetical protein
MAGVPEARVTAHYPTRTTVSLLVISALISSGSYIFMNAASTLLITVATLAVCLAEFRRRITLDGGAVIVVNFWRTRRYKVAQVQALRRQSVVEPAGVEVEFADGHVALVSAHWQHAEALIEAMQRARASVSYRASAALAITDAPVVLPAHRGHGLLGFVVDLALLMMTTALLLLALGAAVMLSIRGVAHAAVGVGVAALSLVGLTAIGSGLRTRFRMRARGDVRLTREGLRVGSVDAPLIPWSEVEAVGGGAVRLRGSARVFVNRDEGEIVRAAWHRYAPAQPAADDHTL